MSKIEKHTICKDSGPNSQGKGHRIPPRRKPTTYQMQVFVCYADYEQLTETKRFNSFLWAKHYMHALRKKYEGDKFSVRIFKTA